MYIKVNRSKECGPVISEHTYVIGQEEYYSLKAPLELYQFSLNDSLRPL